MQDEIWKYLTRIFSLIVKEMEERNKHPRNLE